MPNIAATLSLNVPAITALCKGEPGNTILHGTVSPSGLVGRDGDYYIDTAAGVFYGPKTLGVWGPGVVLNNSSLAPDWSSVYTTVRGGSASWYSTSTTTKDGSAGWDAAYTAVYDNSTKWNNAYTSVAQNSATLTMVRGNSGYWNSTYSTVHSNSANWSSGGAGYDSGVRAITGNWDSSYTTVYNNSAGWGLGGGAGYDLDVRALTGRWSSAYTTTNAYSADWRKSYSVVYSNSARWSNVYTHVRSNSANWEDGYDAYNQLLSARIDWDYCVTQSPVWDLAYQMALTSSQVFVNDIEEWNAAYTMSTEMSAASSNDWNRAVEAVVRGKLDPVFEASGYGGPITGEEMLKYAAYSTLVNLITGMPPRYMYATGSTFVGSESAAIILNSALSALNGYITGIDTSLKPITACIMKDAWFNVPIGWRVEAIQLGTYKMMISGGSGVTVIVPNGNEQYTRTNGSSVNITKIGVNTWVLNGDTSNIP